MSSSVKQIGNSWATRMNAPTEGDIVRACLQLLCLRGIPAWRQNSGAVIGEHKGKRRFVKFCGAEGASDILAILPPAGRLLAIEVKRPGKKPTVKQLGFLERVRQAGGLALVIDDIKQLVDALP